MVPKIKFFKSFCLSFLYILIFITFSGSYGFTLQGDKQPMYVEEKEEYRIRIGINFCERPINSDFYIDSDLNNYKDLGGNKSLLGTWSGSFNLQLSNVNWVNPELKREKILSNVEFGPYLLFLKFNYDDGGRETNLYIGQNNVDYSSVNIEKINKKQMNYWAKGITKNWIETIRGKIFRTNDDELLTHFQTVVYEDKIPIYAFQGEVNLKSIE